jgi:hypothetical protein
MDSAFVTIYNINAPYPIRNLPKMRDRLYWTTSISLHGYILVGNVRSTFKKC